MRKLESFRRDFISNVTHEIKTPVTGMLGAVDLLADENADLDDADRTELQKVLKDQSVQLTARVAHILSPAQLETADAENATEFVPCSVADIVQTAVNRLQPQAKRNGVDLVFDPRPDLVRPCDPRLVESAVSNLIQNALRYSGSKTVELGLSPTPDGKAQIRVTDHGIGIAGECQTRLFERFYRVDKNRSRALGGTGLGLAIVKHIAQLHGGEVTVESAPGEGATFRLVI